jgi:hypothetical protein
VDFKVARVTWLLIVFGMAGPAMVGQYDDDDACYRAAQDYLVQLMQEHKGSDQWHPPAVTCVGVPDQLEPTDGKRI